jgi:hypothetical protein
LAGGGAKQIHETVLTTFRLSASGYGLTQLRCDLRNLKGHGHGEDLAQAIGELFPLWHSGTR